MVDSNIELHERILREVIIRSSVGELKVDGEIPQIDINVALNAPKSVAQALLDVCVETFKSDVDKGFDLICSYVFYLGFLKATEDLFSSTADLFNQVKGRLDGEEGNESITEILTKRIAKKSPSGDRRVSEMLAAGKNHNKKKEDEDDQ